MARQSHEVNLPSNGKIYPVDRVTLKNITVAEEKYLWGSSDNAMDLVLQSCIDFGKGSQMNVDDLIVPDKHFLQVQLRSMTYGDEYELDLRCPVCGRKFKHTVKLSEDLYLDTLDDNYKEPILVTLPDSGVEVGLKIPRSKDVDKFDRLAEKLAERTDQDPREVSYVYKIALGIKSFDGDDMLTTDELFTKVNELSGRDSSYILHQLGKVKVGYDTVLSTDCRSCKSEVKFRLPMTSDFFRAQFND